MEEIPSNTGSTDLYIEQGEGATLANAQFLEVIRNLQQELVQLIRSNEWSLKASEEQEKMIRGLTKKSSHKIVEPELEKLGKKGIELEPSESGGESDRTYPRNQKKNKKNELQGEFHKIKPPTFDREKEEDVESWLLNMTKYFQVYQYEINLKVRLAIYQLQGKATLCWEEAKGVHIMEERIVSLEEFQKQFKN